MNIIFKIFKYIYNFFLLRKSDQKETKEEELAEIIHPLKFKYLPDSNEEETLRSPEESIELFKKFLKAERVKQEEIARKTRDVIIQKKILEMNDKELILHLTSNIFLDEEVQWAIATDEDFGIGIKASLARNIVLSFETQEVLTKCPEPEVRRMLVRWQRPTNPSIGYILAKDPDLEVRKSLAITVGENVKFENVISFRGRKSSLQTLLVDDPSLEVRYSLALNKNLIPETQFQLARKSLELKEWSVIKSLAENESLKEECAEYILEELKGFKINFQVASISKEIKKKIAKNAQTK